jgi:hypothetical protein
MHLGSSANIEFYMTIKEYIVPPVIEPSILTQSLLILHFCYCVVLPLQWHYWVVPPISHLWLFKIPYWVIFPFGTTGPISVATLLLYFIPYPLG